MASSLRNKKIPNHVSYAQSWKTPLIGKNYSTVFRTANFNLPLIGFPQWLFYNNNKANKDGVINLRWSDWKKKKYLTWSHHFAKSASHPPPNWLRLPNASCVVKLNFQWPVGALCCRELVLGKGTKEKAIWMQCDGHQLERCRNYYWTMGECGIQALQKKKYPGLWMCVTWLQIDPLEGDEYNS